MNRTSVPPTKLLARAQQGTLIRTLALPGFSLGSGDVLRLSLPARRTPDDIEALYRALAGDDLVQGLDIYVRAAISSPDDRGLVASRVATIMETDDMSVDLVNEVRERLGKSYPTATVHHLPGDFRARIGLALACRQSSFVVFNVSGVDPLGERALLNDAVQKASSGWGLLCLCHSHDPHASWVTDPDRVLLDWITQSAPT